MQHKHNSNNGNYVYFADNFYNYYKLCPKLSMGFLLSYTAATH